MIKLKQNEHGAVKHIVISLLVVSLFVIAAAYSYYSELHKYNDARVYEAKKMFEEYDRTMKQQKFDRSLIILDDIESLYNKYEEYRSSYECGVVYNNRASVYLMQALYDKNISDEQKQIYLKAAEEHVNKSISIYTSWKEMYKDLDREQIRKQVASYMLVDEDIKYVSFKNNIVNKRVDELIECQKEIDRRLSVSYTNLGTIQRHMKQQEKAVETFQYALKLWPDNHTAQSNFNVLMGKPPKKRSFLQKLFPPSKN